MKTLKKRVFSLLTVCAVALSLAVPAMAAVEDTGFSGVAAGPWDAGAVEYCVENGLMSGTSATTFAPGTAMSRAMLATVLYRAAGSPTVTGSADFADVAAGSWYAAPAAWASQNGIITGYGNGLFGSNDPVTREQIAAILWRAEGSPDAEAGQDYVDEDMIASYASAAVDWVRASGIMNGKENNRFDPKGNATRAEVATILMNYTQEETAAPEPVPNPEPVPDEGADVLVAYFSATGNTENIAEHLQTILGADLYEIVPEEPYTSADLDYTDSSSRSQVEGRDPDARPAISGSVENMEDYEIIFLGYPIWNGQAPKIISTFLETYDFDGKTIVPFCTSGSSGIGSSARNVEGLTSGATWLDGQRFSGSASEDSVAQWVNGLGLELSEEQAA